MIIKCNSTLLNRKTLIKLLRTMTSATQEQRIDVKGQTINYVRVGQGDKTLLCFPGALGTIWSDFKPQIDGLDKSKFTIVSWDPPGYGRSRPPSRNFTTSFYEDDADVAHDFMKQLGHDKYSVLGWSDGGNSAMILAAKYPDAIDKLVVWGANSYILPEESKLYENMRDIGTWSPKMKTPLIELYTEQGLQDLWHSWCDTLIQMAKNGGDICKNRLGDIKCPTFILHGDKDPMVAPEHPAHLFSNIKKAKLHRFPEGKHNIHLRYADQFNKLVTEFILQ